MSLFTADTGDGCRFLRSLCERVDRRGFILLGQAAGFVTPNTYIAVGEFEAVLTSHEFPESNHYEFLWAIHESGHGEIDGHSKWMRLFLAALYVYCDKRKQSGILISSEYHYMVLSLVENEPDGEEIGSLYMSFLEWLQVHVEPDTGFDDYHCLLTWLLIRRLSDTSERPDALRVLDVLDGRRYRVEELEFLTVAERGMDFWLDLHLRIPCPKELEEKYERVLIGR